MAEQSPALSPVCKIHKSLFCSLIIRDCFKHLLLKSPVNYKKFLANLFSKSFRRHRLSEKTQHPKTFINFYQRLNPERFFDLAEAGK